MSHKFLLFLAQAAFVFALTGFHVVAARLAVRRFSGGNTVVRRWLLPLFALIILLLDLPLIHAFVLYKVFHPLILDQLMHDWAVVLLALHANAALFGGILVGGRYVGRPIRRWLRRRRAVTKSETATADMPSATDAAIAMPAGSIAQPAIPFVSIPPRRRFLYAAGMGAVGFATTASTRAAMDAGREHLVERIVVRIPNLPEPLKGTTIALISDIHSSVFMIREDMERYVKVVNNLKAEMIFVTGDFVNSKLREVYPFAEAFSGLSAPLGVYGVTGNHDYYTGNIEKVAQEVGQCGIRLLRNENFAIEKNGTKLWLLGMDDGDIYDVKPYLESGKSVTGNIENLVAGIPDGAPRIFLCHKPYPFEEYSQLGMDLMLSGHTHGGQVVIAHMDNVNLSFAALASRYISGLYRARSNRRSQLYVTRGVGTVGLPLRVNCPPEVTHIVLV